jgi:hypothetical protein
MHFSKALEGGSLEEVEKIYPDLLADLYAVQFLSQKLEAAGDAFHREQQAYADKQAQLQASIQQVGGRWWAGAGGGGQAHSWPNESALRCTAGKNTRPGAGSHHLPPSSSLASAVSLFSQTHHPQAGQDIEDRKRELVEARQELAHKQEYEAIRKQIMQVGVVAGQAGRQAGRQADTQGSLAALQMQQTAQCGC